LIELLGRGGMGEVWRAHDTDTDRIVAIKLLPAHFSDNEEFQRRFRREAHAAAGLNSPHVVPIHNYGEIDGRLYVHMRLIEGRDLQSVLAEGPLEPRRAVRIIEGVALALHAAHQVGLVHRDVKPRAAPALLGGGPIHRQGLYPAAAQIAINSKRRHTPRAHCVVPRQSLATSNLPFEQITDGPNRVRTSNT
jgi:serine/threonine protein kinase